MTDWIHSLPAADRRRVIGALDQIEQDPFSGDVVRLEAQPIAWRRRVGDWRILFDIEPDTRRVLVHDIAKRTSTTY